jgi:hypothetical protein
MFRNVRKEVVIRRRISKDRQHIGHKGQTMIYKAVYRKLKTEQHDPH